MIPHSLDTPLLDMRNVTVAFGPVRVLDGASLQCGYGEIHALLGENGAGKSSLMKALFGLYPMASGSVLLDGTPAHIASPHDALARGIAMIHQELPFARHLTLAQNFFLGREPRTALGFIDEAAQIRGAAAALERFSLHIDPRTPLGRLSIAQQQLVAVARALSTGARLIVMDEATTALTEPETEKLFSMLQQLKAEGRTFILITHRLDEVSAAADRVTVMRDGCTVASLPAPEASAATLVRHMAGREVSDAYPPRPARTTAQAGPPLLRANGLCTRKLREVSFDIRRGEVVGIAGLMGAGRTSLFNALFGSDPCDAGTIELNGTPVRFRTPREAIAAGLAYITEDRRATGLLPHLSVRDNVVLPFLQQYVRAGFVDDRSLDQRAGPLVASLRIRARAEGPAGLLSGGNQQKVLFARWLATGADLFLFDEPTRGIDVGTRQELYLLIHRLAAEGKAVLLASSELPELTALADRFLVLSGGRLVAELPQSENVAEQIVYFASAGMRAAA